MCPAAHDHSYIVFSVTSDKTQMKLLYKVNTIT